MFKVGDKVKYVSSDDYLSKDDIFIVYFVRNDYICITDMSEMNIKSYPMWYSCDFECMRDIRKQKIQKICSSQEKN